MPRAKFTKSQSESALREYEIRKRLCQLEQDGHRQMLKDLNIILNGLLDRPLTKHTHGLIKLVTEEMQWRRDQIAIIEIDKNVAHNMMKYHRKRIQEQSELTAA